MPYTHEVAQGECLASIAKRYHFADWKTIYYHPQNAAFRAKRPNPNIICPGDSLYIPDLDSGHRDAPTDKRHRYVVRSSRVRLRLRIEDRKGVAFAGKQYHLEVEGKPYDGVLGNNGDIDIEIPASASNGKLTVSLDDDEYDDCTWRLKLGYLDPVEEVTGVQARLNNLGCICGPVDGIAGPRTESAVRAFQARMSLPVTGAIDETLQQKLREVHDKA